MLVGMLNVLEKLSCRKILRVNDESTELLLLKRESNQHLLPGRIVLEKYTYLKSPRMILRLLNTKARYRPKSLPLGRKFKKNRVVRGF